MAQNSLIQVRVDDVLKKNAEILFNDLGIDTPTAIRLFLKQSVLRRGIPFPVTVADDFYNEYNMLMLKKSIQQLEQGKVTTKTMEELEAMAADENK